MPIEELMRQLAELVGRALARRWLERSGRPSPTEQPQSGPDSEESGVAHRGRSGDPKGQP
jgi:hypothetical protein